MSINSEESARTTLALLETRLHRLTFLLTGATNGQEASTIPVTSLKPEDIVPSRLKQLEAGLKRLRSLEGQAGGLVRSVDDLRAKHPQLFMTEETSFALSPLESLANVSDKSSVVLSHATLYPETASRLSSLQNLQIPPVEQSTKLSLLQSRINACKDKQKMLETEAEKLRRRSATCIEWWVKVGVVGMNELWEEWESRTDDANVIVRRIERRMKEEANYGR